MSEKPGSPAKTIVVSLLVTGVLVVLCYFAWTESNALVRKFARGTVWLDFRFLVGLFVVFVVLTFADRFIGFVKGKLSNH